MAKPFNFSDANLEKCLSFVSRLRKRSATFAKSREEFFRASYTIQYNDYILLDQEVCFLEKSSEQYNQLPAKQQDAVYAAAAGTSPNTLTGPLGQLAEQISRLWVLQQQRVEAADQLRFVDDAMKNAVRAQKLWNFEGRLSQNNLETAVKSRKKRKKERDAITQKIEKRLNERNLVGDWLMRSPVQPANQDLPKFADIFGKRVAF